MSDIKEEARKAAEVMLAYANGEKIECCRIGDVMWEDCEYPIWDFRNYYYRVKEEPTYRPFKNAEECWEEMLKHQPFGWIKFPSGDIYNINNVTSKGIVITNHLVSYLCEYNFKNIVFADGTPFGVKKPK